MKHTLRLLIMLLLSTGSVLAQESATKESLTLEAFDQKLKQSKSPQILDVRSPAEFEENHLEGAINFNTPDDAAFTKAISKLDKQKPVFVYSINNGRSTVVSKKLREAGFTEVNPLPGGLAHWIGAGKPIVSNAAQGLTPEAYAKLTTGDNVVLVDVGSKHCGGCKKLEPIVAEIEKEKGSMVRVVKLELYDNRALAKSLNIQGIPTVILYKNGKAIWTKTGAITKADIDGALENSL